MMMLPKRKIIIKKTYTEPMNPMTELAEIPPDDAATGDDIVEELWSDRKQTLLCRFYNSLIVKKNNNTVATESTMRPIAAQTASARAAFHQ